MYFGVGHCDSFMFIEMKKFTFSYPNEVSLSCRINQNTRRNHISSSSAKKFNRISCGCESDIVVLNQSIFDQWLQESRLSF